MYGSDQRSVAHCLGKHYADITQHFPRPALVARTFLGGGGGAPSIHKALASRRTLCGETVRVDWNGYMSRANIKKYSEE